mmetsp:Transcript_15868/g.40295  ORF Transcript_15868/g.40295 Transcript_15868/m.40295 type:complete len:1250 (-) Transcript_15868:119-3868(-)
MRGHLHARPHAHAVAAHSVRRLSSRHPPKQAVLHTHSSLGTEKKVQQARCAATNAKAGGAGAGGGGKEEEQQQQGASSSSSSTPGDNKKKQEAKNDSESSPSEPEEPAAAAAAAAAAGAKQPKEESTNGNGKGDDDKETAKAKTTKAKRADSAAPSAEAGASEPTPTPDDDVLVEVDNDTNEKYTVVSIRARNRPGLLTAVTTCFRDLGVDVAKAVVDMEQDDVRDQFFVTTDGGSKLTDKTTLDSVSSLLETVLKSPNLLGGPRSAFGMARPYAVNATNDRTSMSEDERHRSDLLYTLMDTYIKNDVLSVQESIVNHVEYTIARSRYHFDDFEAYQATAYSTRDRLIESWNDTQQYFHDQDPKRVYYLSMEFLVGRSLLNALYNLNLKGLYREALEQLGYNLEIIKERERDAALGNGGLGRLASCFLDSMATENLPAWGYGLRYQYGMFRQTIQDGFQRENPDYWLTLGNPWEIERPNVTYPVSFYGHVSAREEDGRQIFVWNPAEQVDAVAYDNPIPGYRTANTINLRLWSAKPSREFDLESFNSGDYVASILEKQNAESISSVLYPDDRTYKGKELRLKQQHFFVSATLQDILRRYTAQHGSLENFSDKVALQLNDTHPTIGIAELMRLLMDVYKWGWTASWEATTKVFSFTNHTVLPEALEQWPVELLQELLPRHMQIIYDINWRFLQELRAKFGNDQAREYRMSIIQEGDEKMVRMAHLALVASHTVNGVAEIHSELIKQTIFEDFYEMYPKKFQNKTNGVTPRRWLAFCNPPLRNLINETLGTDAWISRLDLLEGLKSHADDGEFQSRWVEVKQLAKAKLAAKIKELCGVEVSTDALFDVQVKRIHEYKRQVLNILGIIHRYDQIRNMSEEEKADVVPRVCIIGGKAAPGYELAKRIIKLISAVSQRVNNDPAVGDLLKVVFIPDYNVSLAEVIVPGSELSQHISTAGTEASGTSNMKCAMNGCLLLASRDGANVEIAEAIGESNIFFFGYTPEQVAMARDEARRTASERSMASDANPAEPPLCAFDPARRAASAPPMAEPLPKSYFEGALVADSLPSPSLSTATNAEAAAASASASPITHIPSESQQPAPAPAPAAGTYGGALPGRLARVVEALRCGAFGDPSAFMSILDSLGTEEDLYMVARDWDAYVDAVERADAAYLDRESWTSMAIQAASRMGPFSSDRAIEEYARDIWSTEPCVYDPAANYPDDDRGDEAHRKKRWIQPGYRHQRAVPSGVSLEKLG